MDRDTALTRLKALEPELRHRGVGALYLFGSVSRNEAGQQSDIDLFFEDAPGILLSYFKVSGIKLWIEDNLHQRIDLIPRGALHPMLRSDIESGAVRVF